jgi:hypothetical protein
MMASRDGEICGRSGLKIPVVCRTSVEMIEKYYASHIKTSLNAVAINVMRPKKRKSKEVSVTDVA